MKYLKYILVIIYLIMISFFLLKSIHILDINSLNEVSLDSVQNKINDIKKNNYYLLVFYAFVYTFIWTLFLGFITPILLITGYILSPIDAALVVSLSNALSGSILITIIRNYLLNDIKKFINFKIQKTINFINRDINLFFFIFRLVGGFGVPSQIQNLIPSFTNIKVSNYIFISIIGCLPIYYISTSIGHSLNLINELTSIDVNIFSNINFLTTVFIIILILFIIKIIKKRFKF